MAGPANQLRETRQSFIPAYDGGDITPLRPQESARARSGASPSAARSNPAVGNRRSTTRPLRHTALAKWRRLRFLLRMLGWSMNLFRIRGIMLAIHFSFFLLLGINAYSGWTDAGWAGLWWDTAILSAFFVCVVLHELGHCFTARSFGIGVRRILLMPIGGMAEFDDIPRQPARELLITLAGPAVNFVIAAVLWLVLPPAGGVHPDAMTAGNFGRMLMQWNLAMGLFNLLPAFPMDGGRILRAMLASRLPYLRATFWAATIGKVICVIGAIVGAFQQPLLMVLFGFIFFVGEMEYRAAVRREVDDAHWRAVLSRFNAVEPTAEEPPLLPR